MNSNMENQVRQTVRTLVVKLAPTQPAEGASAEKLVDDLGYHSLALMELAFAIEDEFHLPPIDQNSAQNITTVTQLADHVLAELAKDETKDVHA